MATVASTAGTPGGTVTFSSGSTALGTGTLNSGAVATLTTNTLAVGTDSVTATYAAGGNFVASTSAPVTITVTAAPVTPVGSYAVAANPTSLTGAAGQTATTTLTFTPTGGYSGTIALSCSNLPANANCSFAQNQVTLTGNDQSLNLALTINTTAQQSAEHAPQRPPIRHCSPWSSGGREARPD
jgi:Bacterial Ig-like domain (group 3)